MTLVAGIDSSTQSCKVLVCDARTGHVVREGRAPHPDGTEVDPRAWADALDRAVAAAGGLDDVAAVSVGGQQHGLVTLDETGTVVRPALLWNDTRSAAAAADLVADLGGGQAWADAVGGGAARRDHRRQGALARRPRTGPRRPRCGTVPAARLAHVAARGSLRRRRARHRPQRRQRHRLLQRRRRLLPHRPPRPRAAWPPARAAPGGRTGRTGRGDGRGRRPRTRCRGQRRRGPRPRRARGRRDRLRRHLGRGLGRLGHPEPRSVRARRRIRRRHRPAPAARVHPQRGAGPRRHGRAARGRPRRTVAARAVGPARRRRSRAGAVPRGRAHPPTGPAPRARSTACA